MGIKEILVGLFFRGKSDKDGIWDFLGKRSADKCRVDLEKARNEGTQKLIPLLGPGVVLVEGGPDWFREIHMPEVLPAGVLFSAVPSPPTIPPLSADELEQAAQNELEQAPQAGTEPEYPAQGACG
jgi:hypothetical protein